MISHQYKCIFIHQRKCAGTSIIRAFDLTTADRDWHYMNDGVLGKDYLNAPPGYFRFSVVRNPWERFVSGWRYCVSTRERPLADVLANLPQQGHDYRHLTRPQHALLYDAQGKLAVDCLMRFETLQQDFDRICDRIGKPRTVLPQLNRSAAPPLTGPYDPELRRLFLAQFGRDLELFDY